MAGPIPIPNLSLSDHSSAAAYQGSSGGAASGAFNVSFGSGAAGTAPASALQRYMPLILIGGAAFWIFRRMK